MHGPNELKCEIMKGSTGFMGKFIEWIKLDYENGYRNSTRHADLIRVEGVN